jgi:hypothetical protein
MHRESQFGFLEVQRSIIVEIPTTLRRSIHEFSFLRQSHHPAAVESYAPVTRQISTMILITSLQPR